MKLPAINFDKVTQSGLESYFKAFRELGGNDDGIGLIEHAGAIVRAAVQVGWLEYDVDNANPREVQAIHREIQAYVKGVLEYDAKN